MTFMLSPTRMGVARGARRVPKLRDKSRLKRTFARRSARSASGRMLGRPMAPSTSCPKRTLIAMILVCPSANGQPMFERGRSPTRKPIVATARGTHSTWARFTVVI